MALTKYLELERTCGVELGEELKEIIAALHYLILIQKMYELSSIFILESHQKLLLSIVQTPILELKPLLDHLK